MKKATQSTANAIQRRGSGAAEKFLDGISGGAGEFGHISIDPGGDLCRCGNRGCLELYASFARPLEQISRIVRRPVTMDDVIMMAEQGDVRALRMIEGHRRVRRPVGSA
ncbi:ROK family protein [Mesorhizobium sp. M1423]|uniref:ROK family protein n=1 Tax=Mesorhizobium sp. M1423 TaxID=2957101 RepID=UPI00333C8A30